ncbi:CLC_0170 family protein [Haloimpatiens sp. FM7330]|uniref:CLC_0170 family protein n=1 Tax=Haloimpatiens sp. FM7330 TaxID=3298610 RepID=UPI00363ADDDF
MDGIKNILDLFDKYFLILMIVQGLVTRIYDYNNFKKNNVISGAKKARVFGDTIIILAICLYILRYIFV